jgi:hypothetical protein
LSPARGRLLRRLAAIVVLLGAGLLFTAGSASADDSGRSFIDQMNDPLNLGNAGNAVRDAICSPTKAPYPELPSDAFALPQGTKGQGQYAQYGYAGLKWTTYDLGCFDTARLDTSIGSVVNGIANSIDGAVNQLQQYVQSNASTTPLQNVISNGVKGLDSAFWTPWLVWALPALGAILALLSMAGFSTKFAAATFSALIVYAGVSFIVAHPDYLSKAAHAMTVEVTKRSSQGMLSLAPGADPNLPKDELFAESYYQMSRRPWLDGNFCGLASAEAKYGDKLHATQAFTIAERERMNTDTKASAEITKKKQDDYVALAKQMKEEDPAAFGCWSGESSSRMNIAGKHLAVAIGAGFWLFIANIAVAVLLDVVWVATLFAVAVGAFMLLSRKVAIGFLRYLVFGALGAAGVSLAAGVLTFGYYAILQDQAQAWWRSVIACIALGAAMFFSRRPLRSMLIGLMAMDAVSHVTHRGGNRMQRFSNGSRGRHRRGRGGGDDDDDYADGQADMDAVDDATEGMEWDESNAEWVPPGGGYSGQPGQQGPPAPVPVGSGGGGGMDMDAVDDGDMGPIGGGGNPRPAVGGPTRPPWRADVEGTGSDGSGRDAWGFPEAPRTTPEQAKKMATDKLAQVRLAQARRPYRNERDEYVPMPVDNDDL